MQDVRWALRALRVSPIASAVCVISLALGIGANTAIFSVVNSLLLRPLPVADPARLVTVSSGFAINHGFKAGAGMNYDTWNRMSERLQAFESGFAWAPGRVDLSEGGETQAAEALFVSGGFFPTLGVPALIGRTFTAADDVRGGGRDGLVVVIGYGLWQRRFAGAADVIGRTLPVDGVACTIVGVMPPAFFGVEVGQPFDVVVPLAIEPLIRGPRGSLHHPSALMLTVMLRLKRDTPLAAATAALRAAQPDILGLNGPNPSRLPAYLKEPYVLVPGATGTSDRSALRRQYTRPLLTILVVAALVLIVACVNIANLLLARAIARRHELGMRLALGATRWRLARQLLTESLVLSSLGAAIGLILAKWAGAALILSLSTTDTRVALDLPLDWRVLGAAAVLTLLTAVLFGTGPAFRAARVAPADVLKEQGRGQGTRAHLSTALIAVQVALSVILLAGTGLFLASFSRLANLPLGFDSGRVLVMDVDTARAHAVPQTRLEFYQQLVDAIATLPGVDGAAASTITPFSGATRSPIFSEPGRVHEYPVTPSYFATYGIRIREGRDFEQRDAANAPRVAVVSESYVRKFFPDQPALGQMLSTRAGCDPQRGGGCATIVGIVDDAIFGQPRGGTRPTIYFPLAQSAGMLAPGRTVISVSLRTTTGSPALLARAAANALTRVHPQLAFSYRPLEQDVNDALIRERVVAALSGFFGVLSLLLSALGLYGVTAYVTSRRRPEIGIRLALGATPASVVRLVLSRVALVVAAGIFAGAAAAFWLSRFVAALLYDVQPGDPATIVSAALILMLVTGLAGWFPAFRASRIDPAIVLRQN